MSWSAHFGMIESIGDLLILHCIGWLTQDQKCSAHDAKLRQSLSGSDHEVCTSHGINKEAHSCNKELDQHMMV